ncbi:MAG TPA: hypothetical protein VM582_08810, partial [Candidatus Thermoplasmatota archaeon]|nr:hypothetical protein [Candidatus Thermoplasmatota archaeon]
VAAEPEPAAARVAAEPPVGRRRFSIGATFLGWSVAAFFTIVFSVIVLAALGGAEARDGVMDLENFALGNFIGYLVAAFLAYLIGGYAAGRIALWNGVGHGLGTVAWAVLFAALALLAGAYAADALNVAMPAGVAGFDATALSGVAIGAILLSLLAMLLGAALGGRLGERYHVARGHHGWRRREARGRPL